MIPHSRNIVRIHFILRDTTSLSISSIQSKKKKIKYTGLFSLRATLIIITRSCIFLKKKNAH